MTIITNHKSFFISILCGFALVVFFQNCSSGNNSLDVGGGPSGAAVSFDVISFNSSQVAKTCFEIGQVGNFAINTVPSNRNVQYTLRKLTGSTANPHNGTIISSAVVTSPAYIQQVFDITAKIGDYSLFVEAKEGSRTIASKVNIISARPAGQCGGTSCEITSTAGLSHIAGQIVGYSITSQPPGLAASLEISENSYEVRPAGITPAIATYASAAAGTFTRAAFVTENGVRIRCSPLLTITVSPPTVPPPPTPTPEVPPTPPPPPPPSGTIAMNPAAYCPIQSGYACPVSVSWSAYNTPTAQLFDSNLTYLGCGESSSATVTLGSEATLRFYLFAASDCTPLVSPSVASAISVSGDMIWYYEVNPVEECIASCGNNYNMDYNTCLMYCYMQYSDVRLKKDIVKIGLENGFNIYEFKYKESARIGKPGQTYIGVMAQEVQKVRPDAVIEEGGILRVRYDLIGVRFREK